MRDGPPPGGVAVIDDAGELAALVARLEAHEVLALDTEFHRERTYRPHLALVQVATADEVAIIDPLAVDVRALAPVVRGGRTLVMHAAGQDLEVLDVSVGALPDRVFDTQVAAGFIGMSSPSLSALHERLLGTRLPKGDRLTDWLERPLGRTQLTYAAADVADLLEIRSRLLAELEQRQRLDWVDSELAGLVKRLHNPRDPEDAWTKIKEVRQLRGPALAVAQAVAAWRERRAAELDIPVRHVLSDMAVVSLAQIQPTDEAALERVRGFDPRSLRPPVRAELVGLMAAATRATPRRLPTPAGSERSRRLRPAATLLSAWLSQRARELQIDPTLLGTRADIEALLDGDPSCRLAEGWRAEIVGSALERLLEGEAALAFTGDGGLVLEARSHEPL